MTLFAAVSVILAILYINIGFCIFCTEFTSDLQLKLCHFSDHLINKDKNVSTIEEQIAMREEFTGLIQFHSEAKELWFFLNLFEEQKQIYFLTINDLFPISSVFRFTNRFSDSNMKVICVFFIYVVLGICSLSLQLNMVKTIECFIFVQNIHLLL